MDWLFRSDYALTPVSVPLVLLGLLLAFLSGQLLAWVYMLTHTGLSYSRSFVNSLVVIPVLVSAVMMVLSNNLVTAFGMMAVFAIVRFRNILRDTLDTSYILTGLVIGMATGTQRFPVAVLVTVVVVGILLFLWYTSFGSRHRHDVIVNLNWARPAGELGDLSTLLRRYSHQTSSTSHSSHAGEEDIDLSYRLLLRDPATLPDLLSELRSLRGVSGVTSLLAEDESEV